MKRRSETFLRLLVQIEEQVYSQVEEVAQKIDREPAWVAEMALHYSVSTGYRQTEHVQPGNRRFSLEIQVTRTVDSYLRELGFSTASTRGLLVEHGLSFASRWFHG